MDLYHYYLYLFVFVLFIRLHGKQFVVFVALMTRKNPADASLHEVVLAMVPETQPYELNQLAAVEFVHGLPFTVNNDNRVDKLI